VSDAKRPTGKKVEGGMAPQALGPKQPVTPPAPPDAGSAQPKQ
jgi:hypothetical protein